MLQDWTGKKAMPMRACTPKLSLPVQYPFWMRCSYQRHKPKQHKAHYNANAIYLVLWWAYIIVSSSSLHMAWNILTEMHYSKAKTEYNEHTYTHFAQAYAYTLQEISSQTNIAGNLLSAWKRRFAMLLLLCRLLHVIFKRNTSIDYLVFKSRTRLQCAIHFYEQSKIRANEWFPCRFMKHTKKKVLKVNGF